MSETSLPTLQFQADASTKQRRVTVFFRSLLALPHFVVLVFLGYAVGFVTMLAWFVALVTGRNPFHGFVRGYLRWYARVMGYSYLLTDVYPPFSFEEMPEYPVTIHLESGSLGRLSVLFRVVLALPAMIVSGFVGLGAALVAVLAWIMTLISGQLPDAIENAFRATIRFHLRVQAYVLLVQNPYPRGLFGDARAGRAGRELSGLSPSSSSRGERIETAVYPSLLEPSSVTTPVPLSPGELASDDDTVTSPTEFMGSLPKAPPIVERRDSTDVSWPLLVSKAGRRVLVGQLFLGGAAYVGYLVLIVALVGNASATRTWSNLYASDIATINTTIRAVQPDFAAPAPNLATISNDCALIIGNLQQISRVPQYPDAAVNRHLLQGIGLTVLTARACHSVGASKNIATLIADMSKALSRAAGQLTLFLHLISSPMAY